MDAVIPKPISCEAVASAKRGRRAHQQLQKDAETEEEGQDEDPTGMPGVNNGYAHPVAHTRCCVCELDGLAQSARQPPAASRRTVFRKLQ
jgi:hypothetical protein